MPPKNRGITRETRPISWGWGVKIRASSPGKTAMTRKAAQVTDKVMVSSRLNVWRTRRKFCAP